MNKNILLQGIKDYQGFNNYWILHLPKHILKFRAEALGDNKDIRILPQQSCPRYEAEDCHRSICNHDQGFPATWDESRFQGEEWKEGDIVTAWEYWSPTS